MSIKNKDWSNKLIGKSKVICVVGNDHKLGIIWLVKCECGENIKRNAIEIDTANRSNKSVRCDICAQKQTTKLSNSTLDLFTQKKN